MRTHKTLSLLLGGLLVLSALALVAWPAMAVPGQAANNGHSDNAGGAAADPADIEDAYLRGLSESLMGKMSYSNGYGQGGFVFYTLDEENGTITDYGLITSEGEKVLIDNISVHGFVPEDVDVHGSIARLVDGDTIAVIHDNPTGMYHLFVEDATNITIVLAGDMQVIEEKVLDDATDLTYQLVISDGTSNGVIASSDPFKVSENGTLIECEVGEQLMIRFLPQVAHRNQWMEMVVMEAIMDGRIAAEVTLVGDGDGAVYDSVSYRQEIQVQVQKASKNRFNLNVQGENPQGALMLVRTEANTMDMSQDRLRVRLNDQEMRFADPLELLYGQPEDPCYAVMDDGETQQMLVYLPSASLGLVTVEGVDAMADLMSPSGLAMIAGALALVALAGVVVFRKR